MIATALGFSVAGALAMAGVLLVLKREWTMWLVERTTVYSAKRLRGSYLRDLEPAKRRSRWLVPAMCFIAAGCVTVSTLRATF